MQNRQIMRNVILMIVSLCTCISSPYCCGYEQGYFVDVPVNSWYEASVGICFDRGIMLGTGDKCFSPEQNLSREECSVLALRVYDLEHGGTSVFEKAPDGWGIIELKIGESMTLTGIAYDGSPVNGYSSEITWSLAKTNRRGFEAEKAISMEFPFGDPNTSSGYDLRDCTAELTIGGITYTGRMRDSILSNASGFRVYFEPDSPGDFCPTLESIWGYGVEPEVWYRDAWYYACMNSVPLSVLTRWGTAIRTEYAFKMWSVANLNLEAINTFANVPDCNQYYVLDLYNAGILTGIDDLGNFNPNGTLSRAEAATMAARILEPNLRIKQERQRDS